MNELQNASEGGWERGWERGLYGTSGVRVIFDCVSVESLLSNCMYFDAENCAILDKLKMCLCDDITNEIL